VKRLAGGLLLTILTFSLPGATIHDSLRDFLPNDNSQVVAQEKSRDAGRSRTESRDRGTGQRIGTQLLDNIKKMDISLDSAAIEVRRKSQSTPQVSVDWCISCQDSPAAGQCDSADLKIEFTVEHGVLRIWDTFQPRSARVRPKLEITIIYCDVQGIKARVENGILQATSPPELELVLRNGTASLSGDLNNSSSVYIINGTLDFNCLLSKGKHEFNMENGSAEVRFRKGSSLKYEARVRTGSVEVNRPDQVSSDEDITDRAEGTLGGGAGELQIEIGVGSVFLVIM
jgi:hypothetical protein